MYFNYLGQATNNAVKFHALEQGLELKARERVVNVVIEVYSTVAIHVQEGVSIHVQEGSSVALWLSM